MDLSERGATTRRHPWEVARLAAYRRVLADHRALRAERVLDVGAGDGWFSESLLSDLPATASVVCWDINYNELELDTDDPRLIRTTTAPSPGFDLVLVLDVLEHIEDPARFLQRELRPLTAPGTPVLVAAPAHPWLFSNHDRALGHHRRYRRRQLLGELAPWIDVTDHGPLFTSLVPLRAASVAVERLRRDKRDAGPHGVGDWKGGPLVTKAVASALSADAALTRRLGPLGRRLPGLSHWAFGYTR